MNSQKEAFLFQEADSYFSRNQSILSSYSVENDPVLNILREYNYYPKNVLEIGCNAGYRLNGIKTIFPNSNVVGIEPSKKAIEYGEAHFHKDIVFHHGTADNLSVFHDSQFDLVIVGFLFYVIDRNLLLKTVAEIDRVLQDSGVLANIDFYATTPHTRTYIHIKNIEAYSYKQAYENIFIASHLYQLTDKRSFNHSTKKNDMTDDFSNKMCITFLQKNLKAGYNQIL